MSERTRILIVEDESLVARDIQNMLKGLGYEVTAVVTSGELALEKAAANPPDIALMDIVLKGEIDGITAAEKLWKEHGIPVIYLTAYVDDLTFQRAKASGPFGYLLKPFEERELLTTVEMALYKSRMEKKLREREQWLSTILRFVGDGIIATDRQGGVAFMNPLAEELTGWVQAESLRQPIDTVFSLAPRQAGESAGPPGEGATALLEGLLHTRDGREIPIERTLTSIAGSQREGAGQVLVFRDISRRKQAERELKNSRDRLRRTLEGTIQAMSATVEMRDPYTAGHQRRVSLLAAAIAQEMGLEPALIEGLRMAGDIHDIGKIYVPAEILSKPGKLTDIEYSIIRTHSQVGYDILKNVEFPWPIARIVVQHHEREDGSGYPAGLKSEAILLEARILAVADVVEAMSSHRPYRPAHGIGRALEEIEAGKGRLYDAAVVDACLRLFRENRYSLE
jgi:PAS domain S-box-containing protein/putative nucleotidyltransferase with HDIG domain